MQSGEGFSAIARPALVLLADDLVLPQPAGPVPEIRLKACSRF